MRIKKDNRTPLVKAMEVNKALQGASEKAVKKDGPVINIEEGDNGEWLQSMRKKKSK
jgi:hypothetical protein